MLLNAMNELGLWMTWKTLGCELKALEAMNNSKLWIIWMNQDPVDSYAQSGLLIKNIYKSYDLILA